MKYQLYPLGDQAIVIDLGDSINKDIHQRVRTVMLQLDEQSFDWMIEYVSSFTSVTIYYDPIKVIKAQSCSSPTLPYDFVAQTINRLLQTSEPKRITDPQVVEIPVLYGGKAGPDLKEVAQYNRLAPKEVIDIHTSKAYFVYMIGFAPGFPYLGGMSKRIAMPRKPTPRLSIPAGSVGIAGEQTGIYPIATPGGWQIIGQTPVKLFTPSYSPPSLLQAGDSIRFTSITAEEFEALGDKHD
ncbi:inhibitor of KinA [Salinibacillus kushneri]|uniref:Inhibitor of KinA n=1 Tax=Salinibacillus kushneri TaxID=237682 RepID=A0A1I0CMT5_9BACI|nr:5-oxoprolinase subunit PxpB [Salinibacillus kushneri]SET21027.1 inhibitor of KinA [Salinibacillus kushneri]